MSSVAVQAAPAPRAASPVVEGEGFIGGALWPLLAALLAGLFIVLVLDNDDNVPASP